MRPERHRRERKYPVGKSRNKKASMAIGITEPQLDSQASARPAGKDPRPAISACSAYWFEKPLRPSARPATRNSQPIRFCGRLEARTNPTTGMATLTTCWETLETFQPVRLAGTRCRSRYASASPPPISATDPVAAHTGTHRAVRALIWVPSLPPIKAAADASQMRRAATCVCGSRVGRSPFRHASHAMPGPFRDNLPLGAKHPASRRSPDVS